MSLKGFHILFITLSVLLAVGFGAWASREYVVTHHLGYLATALIALASGAGLVIYAGRFLRKCRDFGIM